MSETSLKKYTSQGAQIKLDQIIKKFMSETIEKSA